MNYKLWFWIVNIFTAVLRLLFIGRVGLTVDEAHYWTYTKFLSLSYFDHPPLIAYIIKGSTLIFGNTEFGVRFPAVLIFFIASFIFYVCVKKLYDEKTAFFAVLLLNVLPVFSFLGSVISIPDSPLALFWILSFFILIKIIETKNRNLWYLFGICVGFAMLSKYNAVMLPAGAVLFALLSPSHRFWFKEKRFWFSFLIAFAIFTPVVIWNIENNFASFGFQLRHGFGSGLPKLSLTFFGRAIGAQAGYVSPLIFPVFLAAAYICIKEAFIKKNAAARLIFCFSLPTLILFNCVALFNEILPHWPAMGYLILSIYAAHITMKFWYKIWFRIYTGIAWGFTIFILIIAPLHIMYKIIPMEKFLPQAQAQKIKHGIPEIERIDVTNDLFGWKEIGGEIRRRLDKYPPKSRPFLLTHKSYLASQLAFAAAEQRVFCLSGKIDAYDIWQRDISPLKNKNALFICSDVFYFDPKEYGNAFKFYSDTEEFPIYRNGVKVKNFFFTECKDFSPSKLEDRYGAKALGGKKNLSAQLLKFDKAVFKFMNVKIKNPVFDFYISLFSFCDSKNFNLSFFIILVFSIAVLWANRRGNFWTNLALMACILAVSTVIVHFLKYYFERPRPLSALGQENVNFFYERIFKNSFPSGHTQAAFAVCAFMYMTVKKYWYWYIFLAFAVGFERMYAGSHYPADVFFGAIIGSLTAYIMVKFFKKRQCSAESNDHKSIA
ncbi:MAG: glycosyltransferase family 39 protein [Endomicrobium sp.]|jgi:membrane-associated phospholipid phosphatase|nr:glycosyltransferase family 39 protein [Endomicrobium sp.]